MVAESTDTKQPLPADTRTLVFGDSITLGTWDPQGGWADRLKRDLQQRTHSNNFKPKHQLYNLGIGGETSAKLAGRIAGEISARHSPSWPLSFVIAIGINDTRIPAGQTTHEVEIEAYIKNLSQIASVCRVHSSTILVVGLTPISEDVLRFKDMTYYQAAIAQYDSRLKAWAAGQGIDFVDVYPNLYDNPAYTQSLVDGIHPGEAGHAVLYELIRPQLMRLVGAE